jgi:hypothetical protein
MPAASFHEYARNLSDHLHEILRSGQAKTLALEVDQRSVTRGRISGIITFEDQSELHFREFIDVSQPEPKLAFAYHYQGVEGELIFRYDNAAHRPSLVMFPHKHIAIKVVECPVPTLTDVIDEILKRREP